MSNSTDVNTPKNVQVKKIDHKWSNLFTKDNNSLIPLVLVTPDKNIHLHQPRKIKVPGTLLG